jgi:plexin A
LTTHGANFCPRFLNSEDSILLPNNMQKEIRLQVDNLPHPQAGHSGFQCIVTIEGAKMMVPARVEQRRFIVCDKTTVGVLSKRVFKL